MFTLLETSRATIDLPECAFLLTVIGRLIPGLNDDDAIKLLVCLILVRVAGSAPQTLTMCMLLLTGPR